MTRYRVIYSVYRVSGVQTKEFVCNDVIESLEVFGFLRQMKTNYKLAAPEGEWCEWVEDHFRVEVLDTDESYLEM